MCPIENGHNRILPIDYVTFVIVDNTTDNIVSIVIELAQSEDLTTSCYFAESQLRRRIEACTIGRQKQYSKELFIQVSFSLSIRVLTCT